MSISLICSCGARLEIDAKFAGQTIACPDCHKPLTAQPPPPPPTRTSGLALASLLMAIIGAFTVVGTVAAVVVGAIAYRRIPKQPGVGGREIAKAGMILGGVLTVAALAAYSSGVVLGLDGLMRQYVWAGKLKLPEELTVVKESSSRTYSLQRPTPRWGVLDQLPSSARGGEHAMLVEPRADAYILWLSDSIHPEDDAFNQRQKALQMFHGSALVRLIGKLPDGLEVAGLKERDVTEQGREQLFLLDAPLGGIERTLLFRLATEGDRIQVVIGAARKGRFAGLEKTLRAGVDSFKQELNR